MLGRQTSWELGNRSYIRQKVIALYEQIFAQPAAHGASTFPPESVWRELFLLNVNAAWLRERVDAMSEGEIMGPRKPLFRELFSRCIAQLASEELGRHALETLGVLLSALGCKSFSDPSSDTLELFCGIQQVEAVMAELLGGLRKMLGGQNADLVHAAVSGALCVCCLTSNVDQSILIEFLSGEGLAQDVHGLLHGARPKVDSPALREQALKLTAILSSYHKFEASNPSRRRLQAGRTAAEVSRRLAPSAALLSAANIGPAEPALGAPTTAPESAAATVAGTLYWAFQRSLEVLTLDDLVPGGSASGSMDAAIEGACRSELLAAALLAYEVVSSNPAAFGTAFFCVLSPAGGGRAQNGARRGVGPARSGSGGERGRAKALPSGVSASGAAAAVGGQGDGTGDGASAAEGAGGGEAEVDGPGAGGSMSSPSSDRATAHCATLRHLITLATLGALELKRPGAIVVTRLCLLTLLSAASSDALLKAAHARALGGDLPLWRAERGSAVLRRTTRHATIASALLEMATLILTQNVRKGMGVPAEVVHSALLLLQRLMLFQLGASLRLADGAWRPLWGAVLLSLLHCGLNREIPDGDSHSSWLCLCLQHLSVVNLVLVHGAAFLPQADLQQQLAYEVVRQHREFERLFKEGKRRDQSGRLVAALALVRRIIVATLEKLEAPIGPSHSQADVMGALRELQLDVEPQLAAGLRKWQLPPENPTHVPFFQAVSRQLVAGYRSDATLDFQQEVSAQVQRQRSSSSAGDGPVSSGAGRR